MTLIIILSLIVILVFGYAAYHAIDFVDKIYTAGQIVAGIEPKKKKKRKGKKDKKAI